MVGLWMTPAVLTGLCGLLWVTTWLEHRVEDEPVPVARSVDVGLRATATALRG
jgi:hypothetical protein